MTTSEPDNEGLTTYDLIKRSAQKGLSLQRDNGSFPPGQNYTYGEPETPVRTTSHWLEIFSKTYEITEDDEIADAANRAIDYLLSDEIRPHGYTYHCRNTDSKDNCNGLVGQVSPIRALIKASDAFGRIDALETATEVFLLHPFNDEIRLWERVEIDGQKLSFDRTLNHQILFAVAGSRLAQEVEAAETRVERFLDHLEEDMHLHSDGLIKHYVRPPFPSVLKLLSRTPRHYHLLINEVAFRYYSHVSERKKKERGYQAVNLAALSKLKQQFPHHEFWDCTTLKNALGYLHTHEDDLLNQKNTNHGSPIQGIGIARVHSYLEGEPIENQIHLLKKELRFTSEKEENIFDIDGVDENTEAGLVSTLTDFPNLKLK